MEKRREGRGEEGKKGMGPYYYGRGKEVSEGDRKEENGGRKGKRFAGPMSHCFLR